MCGILDTVSSWSTKAGKWWEGVDPTTHGMFDEMIRTDNKVVREAGRNAKNNFGGLLGEWGAKLENDANKNVNNPDGAVGKAALVAAAIMGGASASSGGATGSAAAGDSMSELGAGYQAEAGSATTSAASNAGGNSTLSNVGRGVAQAAATSAVNTLLSPKPERPRAGAVTAMPDPQAQAEARRRRLLEQLARRGRASTILTDSGGGAGLG